MLKNLPKYINKSKFTTVVTGNSAVAHVAYALSEDCFIYPITPSSPIAEEVESFVGTGRKNIYGQDVNVFEMQSELGAAGAVHGSLIAGGITSTFTASQGLLLMLPNIFKVAGELLPGVWHVAARAVAGQALSIFGDHTDINAVRTSGVCLLCSANVQEAHDMAIVAHAAALKTSLPFLHFMDGFRTSHEVHKIEMLDYEEMEDFVDYQDVKRFKDRSLNPENPTLCGTAQNPDIFMQIVEKANSNYDATPEIVKYCLKKVSEKTGREYELFDYIGPKDAESLIVIMGSASDCVEEVVQYKNQKGEKVGMIKVRLYRPWSELDFTSVIPKTVKKIAVLDRTKEPGSLGEPLYLDVCTSIYNQRPEIEVIGGRYGLGQKEFTPSCVLAVYDNLNKEEPKNHFTVGIKDDVTFTSLDLAEELDTVPEGTIQCVFWGIGGDGTVGANHDAIEIIGENTPMHVQGYFSYDAKKSGGITQSHLRFGKEKINSTYLITNSDYSACHVQSYVEKFSKKLVANLKENGVFVLNSKWKTLEEIEANFPAELMEEIAKKNIKFYNIDAEEIAREIGLENKVSMIMQAVFFKLSKVLEIEEAVKLLKESIKSSFSKKGDEIVEMNNKAVDEGIKRVFEVKYDAKKWLSMPEKPKERVKVPEGHLKDFYDKFIEPVSLLSGDDLPVSEVPIAGQFPTGTSRFEKRKVVTRVPRWIPEKCVQCNACAFVCPHAVIRPFLFTEEELKDAPNTLTTLDCNDKKLNDLKFKIQVSIDDCVFCQNCIEECPAGALEIAEYIECEASGERENWDFCMSVPHKGDLIKERGVNTHQVKGTGYLYPYLEFHGACAGCGEAPYVKILTQLYGDNLIIANATGCSSIWGGYTPTVPYCTNDEGHGPAWGNSLFEDAAEYGMGMTLSIEHQRKHMQIMIEKALKKGVNDKNLEKNLNLLLENFDDYEESEKYARLVKQDLPEQDDDMQFIIDRKNLLSRKKVWCVGGDGWAFDIGFGGVVHALATGENIKILVLNTEVYSNTGGQASKATPTGAIAKFAATGKEGPRMDLGAIAMALKEVYVASVSLGANKQHYLNALKEAQEFDGPALILAYAPCIAQGISGNMKFTQEEEKLAVQSGYWSLYRYNPSKDKRFSLDYKKVNFDKMDELFENELRFSNLKKSHPDNFDRLTEVCKNEAKDRFAKWSQMEENQ